MPGLSVTIIARNEEKNLPRAIRSVVGVADEIIVLDTGSTDGTEIVARKLGARVAHFQWYDDFSAAYNYCNDLANGDWLLMLDADEELSADSRDEVATCVAQDNVLAFSVLRQDLIDPMRPDEFTELWQVRLFRNLDDLRFVGRIHHHFAPPLETVATNLNLELRQSDIRLRHYGYAASLTKQKHERNKRLLKLELRDRPGQFYYLVELGLTQVSQGEKEGYERLAEAASIVADREQQANLPRGQLAMLLEFILVHPTLTSEFPLSRNDARKMARERFPNAVPLLWHLAGEFNAQGHFAECARLLERILTLGEMHAYDHDVSFNPTIIGDDARLNLGACYVRLGRIAEAKCIFEMLLDSPTRGKLAAQNLKAIRKLRR